MQEPSEVMPHFKTAFTTTAVARGRKLIGPVKPKPPNAPPKLPHITKLMALAIRLEHLLATGQITDQAEIARTAGITRARVTQILNLTQLAPDIQQAILDLEPTIDQFPRFRENEMREIAIELSWEKQRVLWKRLIKSSPIVSVNS